MIPEFERLARQDPKGVCFTFLEKGQRPQEFTYEELRMKATALVELLRRRGIQRNDMVSLDMSNCPAFVISALAAAYGGFSLVALNHRLTEEEKSERLSDLQLSCHVRQMYHLNEEKVEFLLASVDILQKEPAETKTGIFGRRFSKKAAKKAAAGATVLTEGELVHFAEHNTALFDDTKQALALFTSGTSGRPKAVSLTWGNLCGAAEASNKILNTPAKGLWQAVLPLFHIGGFEIVIRSILNATPFLLYRRFSPEQVLEDVQKYGATHISVVDKMLQDMLLANNVDHVRGNIEFYQCILLGGAASNPITLSKAVESNARVYMSYGMTETSSQIASHLVDKDFQGLLDLLPGYEVQLITPDESGYGQLAVKGPGVLKTYLNAPTPFTVDKFFLTGDTAAIKQDKIQLKERMSDMFISGGENIYPAEIQNKLLRIPGVSDAYAFGVEDETWGRRPVAFVEIDCGEIPPQHFEGEIRKSLEHRLSKLYHPRHICIMQEFPRMGIGKIDKESMSQLYEERLEIKEVNLYHIKQKLVKPFVTAKTTMRHRESIIIEIIDWQGRSGLGECVAFPTDWYLPETLGEDVKVLEEHLIPLVLNQVYLHPGEVTPCLETCEQASDHPLAKGALEPAFWDLYGKITKTPLWELIGGTPPVSAQSPSIDLQQTTPAGMVLGIASIPKTLEAAQAAVDAGYTRIKLKIRPGDDVERVKAVREAHPDLIITLDANQSYTERNKETLKAFDALNISCIEEPLDPMKLPAVGPSNLFARLSRLQSALKTPICLDESILSFADAQNVLASTDLRWYALKVGKWGGVQNSLDFYRAAQEKGVDLWMGGMYETGVSKMLHAAFQTLPGITLPGDISSTSRYFTTEIIDPAFEVIDGVILINTAEHPYGLGCELNSEEIEKVLVEKRSFRRAEGEDIR